MDKKLFLKEHISWLSDIERDGRLAGTSGEAAAANYIERQFLQYGLFGAGDDETYIQQFLLTGPMPQALGVDNHISRNVVGKVNGTEFPDQFIIIGAHYDGQGTGGLISMDHDAEPKFHPSADDNASGTAALLWLAKSFAENPPARSILFVAFSGEELGLLGSRFFAVNMQVEKDSVLAMINLDMVGRLDDGELTIFGTGTSSGWNDLLDEVDIDSLDVRRSASGTGASDHTSFYEIDIPVLHYFSGTHEQYHRATDTEELIDYDGLNLITEHVKEVVSHLSLVDKDRMDFTSAGDPHAGGNMPMNGVSLGVIPDYSHSGVGFRVTSVREGGAAQEAGMEDGDIIVKMGDIEIADIYEYMNALREFENGEEIIVEVLRANRRIQLTVTL